MLEQTLPLIACDYCFMGRKTSFEAAEKDTIPIIVHKCTVDRWVTAHPVPRKGPEAWVAKTVTADLARWNYTQFVYKSDQEDSIVALKKKCVQELRKLNGDLIRVEYEHSGVGESASNSFIERTIWEVEGLVRTLVHQVEAFHRCTIPMDHCIRLWAVEYAPQLLSRYQRAASDGQTAFELRRGRTWRRALPHFCEPV